MDQTAITRIRESFAAQSLMATFAARMTEVDAGHIRITAPIQANDLQQQGFGHAGLTFSIGDSAAGYAGLTTLPLDQEVVTAEMKVNLLAPARGDRLIATGRVIKPGRRIIVVSAEVHAESDGKTTLIAVLQGTMVPVPA